MENNTIDPDSVKFSPDSLSANLTFDVVLYSPTAGYPNLYLKNLTLDYTFTFKPCSQILKHWVSLKNGNLLFVEVTGLEGSGLRGSGVPRKQPDLCRMGPQSNDWSSLAYKILKYVKIYLLGPIFCVRVQGLVYLGLQGLLLIGI